MATKKRKPKKRLVCPVEYRGKRVRASKGACFITLASGKKKRVKKVASRWADHEKRRDSADARHIKRMRADPVYRERIISESERKQGLKPGSDSTSRRFFAGRR